MCLKIYLVSIISNLLMCYPFTDIKLSFLRALVWMKCALMWMNPIWSLFALTACSFSQHVNLSCISSFTSITCIFSPYTNACIFSLFTMIEHVFSLLPGVCIIYFIIYVCIFFVCLSSYVFTIYICNFVLQLFDGKEGREKYPRRWVILPPFL